MARYPGVLGHSGGGWGKLGQTLGRYIMPMQNKLDMYVTSFESLIYLQFFETTLMHFHAFMISNNRLIGVLHIWYIVRWVKKCVLY